jgi:hypothetical protein
MLQKLSLLALLLVLVQLMVNGATLDRSQPSKRLFGYDDDDSSVYDDTVENWSALNPKVYALKTNETSLSEQELFAKIKECIAKCAAAVNPDNTVRDVCIATTCDIYKK